MLWDDGNIEKKKWEGMVAILIILTVVPCEVALPSRKGVPHPFSTNLQGLWSLSVSTANRLREPEKNGGGSELSHELGG